MSQKWSEGKSTGVPASDLPKLAAPAQRALAAAGITHLEQLTRLSKAELLQLHGMGPNAMRTLKTALSERGLQFANENASQRTSAKANLKVERRPPKKRD